MNKIENRIGVFIAVTLLFFPAILCGQEKLLDSLYIHVYNKTYKLTSFEDTINLEQNVLRSVCIQLQQDNTVIGRNHFVIDRNCPLDGFVKIKKDVNGFIIAYSFCDGYKFVFSKAQFVYDKHVGDFILYRYDETIIDRQYPEQEDKKREYVIPSKKAIRLAVFSPEEIRRNFSGTSRHWQTER